MFGKKTKTTVHTYGNRGRFEVVVDGRREIAPSAMRAQKLVREAKAAGKQANWRQV